MVIYAVLKLCIEFSISAIVSNEIPNRCVKGLKLLRSGSRSALAGQIDLALRMAFQIVPLPRYMSILESLCK